MSTEHVEPWKKYRKLPLKIWYRPMDLSAETERMLDEAMVRLDVDKPDLAIHAALKRTAWKAWKRTNGRLLYGSRTRNMMPVMKPTR